jgi:hypothetical protein
LQSGRSKHFASDNLAILPFCTVRDLGAAARVATAAIQDFRQEVGASVCHRAAVEYFLEIADSIPSALRSSIE